ncbi:hypothetical protein AAE02nite_50990 [Adhaeribacter aerolatus]|uniref:Ig-like domain-containing protein n=1 Tax=Adhaeribacter aerolatus TaxID=670289 RepID=A0A512B646_9BACT|nr:T9SS type A sorting domain-containing protein [Adhaeribacter aerolatus]GEO07435.1 hypothetical protein AAE02nite_50990 [Adhaeribacter aerolatus]
MHDGGLATNASISLPLGVAADQYGNIFIADFHANSVRKVNAGTGIISTVAGNGTAGSTAGGGLATQTPLNGPTDVAVDANGNLYILDIGNNCIWKVNASDGIINKIETFTSSFATEGDITLDAAGTVYYAKTNRVMKVNANGPPIKIAGNGTGGYSGDGGLAVNALVKDVGGIAVDTDGNIYISGDNRIRKINASNGIIQTIAGNGTAGYSGDGGLAVNALLKSGAIALDANNNIYLTEGTNNRVRKINASNGIISTIAGNGPSGFISSDGISGYKGDGGLATNAWLNIPSNIAVDQNQNIYIADIYNFRIRKITNQIGPGIITQPVAAIVNAGENTGFTVVAEGTGLTYQWQVYTGDGTYTNITDGGVYAGTTTANLNIKQVTGAMNGYRYRVQVSNGNTRISASASLTVNLPVVDNISVWQVVGKSGFSVGQADYISLVLDAKGIPYVVYTDKENGDKATVQKYSNNNWEYVGSAGFSAVRASSTSIALDAKGTPYVVYVDAVSFSNETNSQQANVKKFDGSNWVDVGTPGISAGIAGHTRLALDTNGTPFIVYRDYANNYKATVKKFDGSNWVDVGIPGFSSMMADYTTIAVDVNNTPFVAYSEDGKGSRATVKKFNGSSWIDVGSPSFSAGRAEGISLVLDANGNPFVAYKDYANGYKATVKKFNGSNWEDVGLPGFSAGEIVWASLALSTNGTPFVAYLDVANGAKATVKKFNGSSWVDVGTPGFSAGQAYFTSLALDTNDTPFVAYSDYGNNGARTTVMKFNSAIPTTPTVTGAANCGPGAVTLTATGAADGNYRWYTTAAAGSPISSATNATFTTPELEATKTYYVSVVNGTDESERVAVTATINPIPVVPVVTPNFSFCQGATATALSAMGNNLKWYTTATGETTLATAPIPNTTTTGITEYYVSQTVNSCESQRVKIAVTVTASPVVNLEGIKEVCSTVSNLVLTGGQPAGGIYSGSGVNNGIFDATEAGVGTHLITYSFTDANGCTSSAVQNITVATCTNNKAIEVISNLILSPNPTTGEVRVKATVQEKTDLVVKVISLDGKIVLEKKFPNVEGEFDKVIDLKGIARGIYLLQNITDRGMVKKRLVIE